jgi:hypothetical protein
MHPPHAATHAKPGAAQQATRHARRIYVGGLPPGVTDDAVQDFFVHALTAIGGCVAGPGETGVWLRVCGWMRLAAAAEAVAAAFAEAAVE